MARAADGPFVYHCILCEVCDRRSCRHLASHPWNVDSPHSMLRAKALKHPQLGLELAAAARRALAVDLDA